MKLLLEIFQWRNHGEFFDPEYAFVPFGMSRTNHSFDEGGYRGYCHYRIFGIRIAKIQETKPWESFRKE